MDTATKPSFISALGRARAIMLKAEPKLDLTLLEFRKSGGRWTKKPSALVITIRRSFHDSARHAEFNSDWTRKWNQQNRAIEAVRAALGGVISEPVSEGYDYIITTRTLKVEVAK